MKNSMLYIVLALAIGACQMDDEIFLEDQITAIASDEIPAASQAFVDTYFTGEVVTDFYMVSDQNGNKTHEMFLSNNTNLVFDDQSDLHGFGNINSRMEMENERHDGMSGSNMNGNGTYGGGMNGGGMSGGHGNGMGNGDHGFRGHSEASPVEIDPGELPTAVTDYITENYPDLEILMAFIVVWDESETEYHVLVEEVGGLLFDQDGNFVDTIRRGMGRCEDFEEIDVADLSEVILDYISTNYPDDEILRARLGSHDEIEEIHVMLRDAGILIFDTNGNFIELLERRSHHG